MILSQTCLGSTNRPHFEPPSAVRTVRSAGTRHAFGSAFSACMQRELAAVKLLIVDELDYVPLSPTGTELLFETFSQR
ncbi:hypothetical protein MBUL_03168 [Methylobacterium bullatum]|uniref:Uncharacterized protein n=1 Tax=Methylobacterium bullatum TaxID=570505 RepID=A0A679J320_9HYPH|nr:hypothetical protein MBUL_03168 [Methylobacterium bullatum]